MIEGDLKYIELIYRFNSVVLEMESILLDARLKDLKRDFSVQEKRLSVLIELKQRFLEVIEENRIINKKYDEAIYRLVICDDAYKKVSAELENIKKNINF